MTSLLWPCTLTLQVCSSTSDKSQTRHSGRLYPRVRSLSMNCWLNSDAPWNGQAQYKVMRKISDMTFPGPTGIWVITDERDDRINNGFFVVDMSGFNHRNLGRLPLVDISTR